MVRHKPPSRIRYEKSHPTISFRLDEDVKSDLKKVLEKESFADFVKEGLGKRKREKKSLDDAYEKGYDEGFVAGYEKAENKFLIEAPCSICGGSVVIEDEESKRRLVELMVSGRWAHLSCIDAKRRRRRF